jgi:type IV secretory pathway protease TraF
VKRLRVLLWAAGLGACALVAMRALWGDVYALRSASMEPTLHGGQNSEWVLMRYGNGSAIRRFDLVVFKRPGEGAWIVKRVLALPGEALQLTEGDLLINGQLLPLDAPRPPWVTLFDSQRQPLTGWFEFRGAPVGPWQVSSGPAGNPMLGPPALDPGMPGRNTAAAPSGANSGQSTCRLEALELLPGDNGGLMFFDREATTGYLDSSGRSVSQPVEANDLALELEVCLHKAVRQGELRLRLLERGDFFQIRLGLNAAGPIPVYLEREPGSNGRASELLLSAELPREALLGPWCDSQAASEDNASAARTDRAQRTTSIADSFHRLRFSNRDNGLTFHVDGQLVLSASYEQNRAYPGMLPPNRLSVGPRAAFGGAGIAAEFRAVRLERDQQWLSSSVHGAYATNGRLILGPGECFVAGDNSFDSTDSRYFGPIQRSAIVGRPIAVCWPPNRWRWL